MNIKEYNEIKNLNYEEYCNYLDKKHGQPVAKYGSVKNNKTESEGLVIHHKREDRAVMLSNANHAKFFPKEYQNKENLVYCDLLEHLHLHILIAEFSRGRDIIPPKPYTEAFGADRLDVGVGGVVNHIAPMLNNFYKHPEDKTNRKMYENISQDQETFNILMNRFYNISPLYKMLYNTDREKAFLELPVKDLKIVWKNGNIAHKKIKKYLDTLATDEERKEKQIVIEKAIEQVKEQKAQGVKKDYTIQVKDLFKEDYPNNDRA